MKTLRRAFAALVAFLLPLSTANAVSLYDGLKTRPAPTAPVVAPTLPNALPQLPTALPTIPQIGIDLSIPQLPTPLAEPRADALASPAAAPAQPGGALPGLQAAGAKLDAAPADPRAALDPLFVGAAISEYFGGALAPGQQPGVVIGRRKANGIDSAPSDGEMLSNVKSSPRTNPEREQIAIRMFQRGGAKYDPATAAVTRPDFNRDGEVQVQEVRGWGGDVSHNIFVVKRGRPTLGRPERVIVITSHNDKVDVGDGVIDNWTGTTMVAHLYQSIKDRDTEATYVFASFAREEEGLVGSKQFLRSMTPDQRAAIELNTNIDTIAIKGGATNSWENNSDQEWLDAVDAAVAEANAKRGPADQLDLKRERLNGGDADSSTFRDQRPPIIAGTIFSGPEDLVFSIIHSANDNFGAFDFALYKNTYLVMMALLDWHETHRVARRAPVGAS